LSSILTAIITGIVTFAATNVDDLLILIFFFSQVNSSFRRGHIVAGQYLGFAALVAISLLGFFGSFILPTAWIGFLGLVPILMGVDKFIRGPTESGPLQADQLGKPSPRLSFLSGFFSRQTMAVAGVTFANGGDNLGIYTPLFAGSGLLRLGILLAIFFLLVSVWCYAGQLLSRRPLIAKTFSRHGRIIVPFVLAGLGIYILLDSGAAALATSWVRHFFLMRS